MKTRILNTDIYRDDYFQSLDDKTKLIALFLLTNDRIGLYPAYKLSLDEIAFYNSTSIAKLQDILPTLAPLGIFHIKPNWLILAEKFTYSNYKGGKTKKAKEKEYTTLPDFIREYVDEQGNIGQSLLNHCSIIEHINHKSETINHKSEIKKSEKVSKSETEQKVLEGFNKITSRQFKVMDKKTEKQLFELLDQGISTKDIGYAILAASQDKFLRGDNDQKKDYLTLEYITRTDKFNQWFAAYHENKNKHS